MIQEGTVKCQNFYMLDLCLMGSRYWRKGPNLACSTLPIKVGGGTTKLGINSERSTSIKQLCWEEQKENVGSTTILLAKSTKDSSYFA